MRESTPLHRPVDCGSTSSARSRNSNGNASGACPRGTGTSQGTWTEARSPSGSSPLVRRAFGADGTPRGSTLGCVEEHCRTAARNRTVACRDKPRLRRARFRPDSLRTSGGVLVATAGGTMNRLSQTHERARSLNPAASPGTIFGGPEQRQVEPSDELVAPDCSSQKCRLVRVQTGEPSL